MPRRISSQLTSLHKFIFPGIFFIGALALTVFGSGAAPRGYEWAAVAIPIACLYFVLRFAWRLKWLSIDENNLYISSYRKAIIIPFSEIADVREFMPSQPRIVTIDLHRPSEFGKKIVFLAPCTFFGWFGPHPVVDELLLLAASKVAFSEPIRRG